MSARASSSSTFLRPLSSVTGESIALDLACDQPLAIVQLLKALFFDNEGCDVDAVRQTDVEGQIVQLVSPAASGGASDQRNIDIGVCMALTARASRTNARP